MAIIVIGALFVFHGTGFDRSSSSPSITASVDAPASIREPDRTKHASKVIPGSVPSPEPAPTEPPKIDTTGERSAKVFGADVFEGGPAAIAKRVDGLRKDLALILEAPADPAADPLELERRAALRYLKAYRFLVKVPWQNLETDERLNDACQAAARLLERIGRLDHRPANPGLPEAEYQLAFKGTSQGNLGMGYRSIVDAINRGWMDDSDARNIERVGHRRWCLNPAMMKTGFGRSGDYTVMYALDQSQPKVPHYDLICYPAYGLMPMSFFGPDHAWIVRPNPARFRPPATVQVCEVDEKLNKLGKALPLSFFKQLDDNLPLCPCIIFRPEGVVLADGKAYLVEIEWPGRTGEQPVVQRYVVVFVNIDAAPQEKSARAARIGSE